MSETTVKVPDIGDSGEVDVIEVLVKEGDSVKEEQSLITVESDKASMEIPSSAAGKVVAVKVSVGDKVSEGSVIIEIEAEGGDSADEDESDNDEQEETKAQDSSDEAEDDDQADDVEASDDEDDIDSEEESAGGSQVEVAVPEIGGTEEVDVIEVLVKEGDTIEAEQSLITVESDKASMEIPSSDAGKIVSLNLKVGDKVSKGDIILTLESSGGAKKSSSKDKKDSKPKTADKAKEQDKKDKPSVGQSKDKAKSDTASVSRASPTASYALSSQEFRNLPHASPSVRKFARELGVDLSQVKGSGKKSRILQDDVRQFVKSALSVSSTARGTQSLGGGGLEILDWPKVDFSKFGSVEVQPLSRIKKISGANLHRNWVMIPHVTNNDEADITALEAFRKQLNTEFEKEGIKFTMLAFLIKAVTMALKKFPEFNASLDDDNLVLKQYYNIGFAADTPNGLVVPVVKDTDKKPISDIAQETRELAKAARDGKLSPKQMQGGCFSISSLGGIGGTTFTPIINAPEVAILGVSRQYMKPVWDGEKFAPRLCLPMSLSYDHRVIDGAAAARFNVYLAELLADFRRAMIQGKI